MLAYEDIQEVDENDNDPNKLISAAKNLAQATEAMIKEIQLKAINEECENSEKRDKLINAAKELAEATTVLVNSAKV